MQTTNKSIAAVAAVVGLACSANAGITPDFVAETSGSSFTQQWRQTRNTNFKPDAFAFELIGGPTGMTMDVALPGSRRCHLHARIGGHQ